jgi:protein-tyrosine-phosphatase
VIGFAQLRLEDLTAMRIVRRIAREVRRASDRVAHPLRHRAAVRRLTRRPRPQVVLVVCHGNICRSPYAAALLRRRLPPLLGSDVRVTSAGFVGPGRPSPDVAVEVAAVRGVDLSGHRSQLLAPPEVSAADLIVVMDTTQQWGIRALFGRQQHDLVMLGDLDPEPITTREILDPFELPKEAFELSYARIDRCIAEFVRAVSLSVQPAPAGPLPSRRDQEQRA